MREICKSGSEGGAGQTNVPFLPLSAPPKNDFVVHDFVKLLRVGINNTQVFPKFDFLFHELRVNRPAFPTCDSF